MLRWLGIALILAPALSSVHADGPKDNQPEKVRQIPPKGVAIKPNERMQLEQKVDRLGQSIEDLRGKFRDRPDLLDLLPDIEIYHKAVDWALRYHEFFHEREIAVADSLVQEGFNRADSLRAGQHKWTEATGLIVRGYRSRIDRSIQPYGLVVPASYRTLSPHRHRLDIWFHGRGETLSELNFIEGRRSSAGEFTPRDAFVLHPYGRYCNANKFAGEVDCLEALEHVRKNYCIDENRIAVRGFSMGGAACWQFATHYAGHWAAAAPGAGFAETAEFLKVFQNEEANPPAYERKLWHLYDCTDYAVNLFNCPTVAYSGELDKQKQAADVMARAMEAEGLKLAHIIGPKTAHAYHPAAKAEIDRRLDGIVARGRNPLPPRVRFTTWTLRYNEMFWVTVDGLDRHWERARVDAELSGTDRVLVKTDNVSGLALSMGAGLAPLDNMRRPQVNLDGQELIAPPVLSDRSWTAHFRKKEKRWVVVDPVQDSGLRKRHGLQGPIDDAFLDSFLIVRPSGQSINQKVNSWVTAEMAHAVAHWRSQFRGDAPLKDDSDITDVDIASNNLILWGDPQSNKILSRIAAALPIVWNQSELRIGAQSFESRNHIPVLIFPNPLCPRRYVVLNSGFTFREYDYLNNARQIPKLPDFAVLDIDVKPDSRHPGGVKVAGFFDEHWALPAESP
jgi:dienelactone hydrolase